MLSTDQQTRVCSAQGSRDAEVHVSLYRTWLRCLGLLEYLGDGITNGQEHCAAVPGVLVVLPDLLLTLSFLN